jgi:hypothetical protein
MDDDILLPAEIDVIDARLPLNYEDAKAKLAECYRIDECLEWQNQAEAIASYARQANDPTLEDYARRIKARAVRQCGKLLIEYDARRTKNGGTVVLHGSATGDAELETVRLTSPSRTQVANEAGLSERQRITATRIARVPDEPFEAAVEAEKPLTLTKIADLAPRQKSQSIPTLTSGMLEEMGRKADAGYIFDALERIHRSGRRVETDDMIDLLLDKRNEHRQTELLDALDFGLSFLQQFKQAVAARGIGRKTAAQKPMPPHLRSVT